MTTRRIWTGTEGGSNNAIWIDHDTTHTTITIGQIDDDSGVDQSMWLDYGTAAIIAAVILRTIGEGNKPEQPAWMTNPDPEPKPATPWWDEPDEEDYDSSASKTGAWDTGHTIDIGPVTVAAPQTPPTSTETTQPADTTTRHRSAVGYTNDDDGIWLWCTCGWSKRIGFGWPTIDNIQGAWDAHTS